MLLNCIIHIRMLLGCGAMLANREMEIYLNYGGYQRLDTNMLSGSSNVMNQNQNQKCFYSILTKSIYKVTMKRFWIRGPLLRPAWSLT